ncbi:MAG: class I SAM-dependent methyltransferase [Deltaproteobacteria bacterium]|nr:class I SAM-dependent methyltransferase [Deltaproteobacteria bacterium]
MTNTPSIDQIIEQFPFRQEVFDLVPEGSSRILDFGCDHGQLLLALRRDKGCDELFGIDVREDLGHLLKERLDGYWTFNLGAPENDLGEEFAGFFNYIVLHDVVEHLYDPWYVLPKLRKNLAMNGLLVIVVPNFRNWEFINSLILGRFRYGTGDLMNEEHIRWFTLEGLEELLQMSGFEVESLDPMFPPNVDLNVLIERIKSPISSLELPPLESTMPDAKITIRFPMGTDIRPEYIHFLANKYLITCRRTFEEINPVQISFGDLAKRRQAT